MRGAAVIGAALVAACGTSATESGIVDAGAGADGGVVAPACEPEEPSILEPVWIAGRGGARAEVGAFGKPDAVYLAPNGVLMVGDEDPTHEELVLFDVRTDDPDLASDPLRSVADIGADPGPGGIGQLEFRGISGFARRDDTGEIYIVEQGNARVQIVRFAADARAAPYLEHVAFFGTRAPDPDAPADGEFVRLQAARFDSLGRLYLSDDGRGGAEPARRDIQVFDTDLQFLEKFGDASYGQIGVDGNLGEPENFTIDEARNRIYVADEQPRNIAVFHFGDRSFLRRFGSFAGIPNGVDVDQHGVIYVMDEGAGQIVLFDPDTFEEVYRFGALSDAGDLTPGTFFSPDTLLIDRARDLIVVTDQGHDRVQAFRLADVQRRACLEPARRLSVIAPPRAVAGKTVTLRVEVRVGGDPDRSVFREQAMVGDTPVELYNGAGSITVPVTGAGPTAFTARWRDLEATRWVDVLDAPPERALTGVLAGADLTWSAADGVIHLSGTTTVPAGSTLVIEPGGLVMLDAGARLDVAGDLVAEGTAEAPIYVFATDPADPWATIAHTGASARYDYLFATGGGDVARVGHCCGPVVQVRGGELRMRRSLIADAPGKGFYAKDADVEISRSQFARLAMGVEFDHNRAVVSGCHVFELRGVNDNDALYFSGDGDYTARRSVFAMSDDDGADLEYADALLEDVVFYGFADKAISISGAAPIVRDCLVLDSHTGIAIKDYKASAPSSPRIEHCTVAGHAGEGVRVFRSSNEEPDLTPVLDEVIVWGSAESVTTVFDPKEITMRYSDVERPIATSGVGNISEDPRFVNTAESDYRLGVGSPAATAGEDGGAIGWPGFR